VARIAEMMGFVDYNDISELSHAAKLFREVVSMN